MADSTLQKYKGKVVVVEPTADTQFYWVGRLADFDIQYIRLSSTLPNECADLCREFDADDVSELQNGLSYSKLELLINHSVIKTIRLHPYLASRRKARKK